MNDTKTHQRLVANGDLLFRQGDQGDCAYIIERGLFEVFIEREDGSQVKLAETGPGELLGEMALIDNQQRSASIRAREDSLVTLISPGQLQERLQRADPVLHLLLTSVIGRLRRTLDPTLNNEPPLPLPQSAAAPNEAARQGAAERLRLEGELQVALEQQQFVLFYQPITALPDGKLAGFEALVRWQHPERGLVPPGLFIPVAEDSPLIIELGHWIMHEAAEALQRFQTQCAQPLFMGINISGKQFGHPSFQDDLQKLLQLDIPTAQIKLEITESLLLSTPDALQLLHQCHDLGFSIAIDDFGTGYSSLSYLHQMPIDTLKIDRSFVISMLRNARSRVIVEFLIQLARGLGMRTVAEGIDDIETLQALIALECDYAQGFLMARPMPEADCHALLQERDTLLPEKTC